MNIEQWFIIPFICGVILTLFGLTMTALSIKEKKYYVLPASMIYLGISLSIVLISFNVYQPFI